MTFILKPVFPENTPVALKNLESLLFTKDPDDRPTFSAILVFLNGKM